MTRVLVFVFFVIIFVCLLNIRSNQNLAISNTSFDMESYSKNYQEELKKLHASKLPKEKEKASEETSVKPSVPVVVLTTDAQKRGQKLYQKCIVCHGKHGTGKKSQQAPKIAGQYDWYIYDKIKSMQDGVWVNKKMYPYIKKLSDRDVKDLSVFLAAYKW